ncbi:MULTISPECIES: hypothetical protein [Ruminococcus]|nr:MULTISPECIES: hypothetical protein [Ruminococcus]MEE3438865.1 hypothetical protein [Ruminococcus sp.]
MKKEYKKPELIVETFSTENVMLVSMTEPFSSVNHTVTGGFDDED